MPLYDKYNGFQSVCNAALGEYIHKGFCLVEGKKHKLHLYHYSEPVDTFCYDVAVSAVRSACVEHLGE